MYNRLEVLHEFQVQHSDYFFFLPKVSFLIILASPCSLSMQSVYAHEDRTGEANNQSIQQGSDRYLQLH